MAELSLDPDTFAMKVEGDNPTTSVVWDRVAQRAAEDAREGPTIVSRAYAMMHTAMYDAWAAGDERADGVHYEAFVCMGEAEIAEAMSHAAHTVLSALQPAQRDRFDAQLIAMGYEPGAGSNAAILGREAANAVLVARAEDGANQNNGYAAPSDANGDPIYAVVNASPTTMTDMARWTPENVPIDATGVPQQQFLTPHWGDVDPFGLVSGDAHRPEAPEPFFLVEGATLDFEGGVVTLADGSRVAVGRELVGTIVNPAFIAQAERVVEASAELTDREKLIAEFWEDGAGTSFPPGNAMTLAQYVSARDGHTQAQDARMFLAVGNAQMDAGIAAWDAKVHYDYARPVRVVRELGRLGLIGQPGTDEITGESGNVVRAWGGPGMGTRTILAENWVPYQTPGSHPSPPFAEYVSGHSTFSAAGAEMLRLFARSDRLCAGVTFPAGSSRFESGETPSEEVTLHWNTFSDAADQSGMSRIYGGIHFDDGDMNGRALGRAVARDAFVRAMGFIQGIGDGAGDDRLRGDRGDDMMAGLGGNDRITTGRGRDGVVFMAGHGNDRITDFDVDGRWRDRRADGGTRADGGERDFDTLILSGLGEHDGEYATARELRELIAEMAADGETTVRVHGRDVVLDFGERGSVRLDRVVGALGGSQSLAALGAELSRRSCDTVSTNIWDALGLPQPTATDKDDAPPPPMITHWDAFALLLRLLAR